MLGAEACRIAPLPPSFPSSLRVHVVHASAVVPLPLLLPTPPIAVHPTRMHLETNAAGQPNWLVGPAPRPHPPHA